MSNNNISSSNNNINSNNTNYKDFNDVQDNIDFNPN